MERASGGKKKKWGKTQNPQQKKPRWSKKMGRGKADFLGCECWTKEGQRGGKGICSPQIKFSGVEEGSEKGAECLVEGGGHCSGKTKESGIRRPGGKGEVNRVKRKP